jgi:hypothetical protein
MSLKIKKPKQKNFERPFSSDVISEFHNFLSQNGLELDQKKGLITDGSVGRAFINVGGKKKLVGWYQLWADQEVPFGRLGDYRVSAQEPTATFRPEHQKNIRSQKNKKKK